MPTSIMDAWQRGDYATAIRVIQEIDNPFFALIGGFRGGFNAGIYGTLEWAGIASRNRRKPYTTICDDEMERLQAFLESIPAKIAGSGKNNI